jgi:hypothetical protein
LSCLFFLKGQRFIFQLKLLESSFPFFWYFFSAADVKT